jgi:gas vesicle protein
LITSEEEEETMHLEQYEPQSSSWRGSLLMFVAGTAIGAAAALMMAPASGRESREYLRKQGRRMADDMGAQADRLTSAVKWGREQATTAVRETMDSAVAQAKAAYDAARSHRAGETHRAGDMAPASASTSRPAINTPRAVSSPS